jgi:hypothetical protein
VEYVVQVIVDGFKYRYTYIEFTKSEAIKRAIAEALSDKNLDLENRNDISVDAYIYNGN